MTGLLLAHLALAAPPDTTVVFVNRDGGLFTSGSEDGWRNRSSILRYHDLDAVTFPPSRRDDAGWAEIMTCARGIYADFDVVFVDERPADPPYILVNVGGDPSLLNVTNDGLGPATNHPIYTGVAFAFERERLYLPGATCRTVAHELGHTLGLDHSALAEDLMGHMSRTIHNQSEPCGHHKPRACKNGEPEQNSYARLTASLGLRPGVAPREPDQLPAIVHTDHDGPCAPSRPQMEVAFMQAGAVDVVPDGQEWVARVEASDPDGIREVSAIFTKGDERIDFPCRDQIHGTLHCRRDGDAYVFGGLLAADTYLVRLRVTDSMGHAWQHIKAVEFH